MQKTIIIDEKPVVFEATGGTVRRYSQHFGAKRNIFNDMTALIEAAQAGDLNSVAEILQNVAYIMAKQATPGIPNTVEEWLDQFSMFGLYNQDVVLQLIQLWLDSAEQATQTKKNNQ